MTRSSSVPTPRSARGIARTGAVAVCRVLVLACCLLAGGCSFLADEFGWYDAAPPRAEPAAPRQP
jgi:hypothetical protein